MLNQYYKKNPIFKVFDSTLVSLPAPSNLSFFWNFGSLLSLCLIIQIITGLLLASCYSPNMLLSFDMISKMMETNDKGWFIRYIHANGASLFFLCLYIHVGRGLYYSSYLYTHTWNIGVTILLLTMAAAFMGYVLPINQMSFWGASVITNLFSEVPYIGKNIVQLIWGSVCVSDPTIIRFFTFHFILPFIILACVVIHITLLHQTGSSNPLGVMSNLDKMPFHNYFSSKDLMGVLLASFMFIYICLYYPLILGDDENFTPANPSVTPHHIQPEWYFLFAYAILRSIPNKLGGVIALVFSIMILYLTPMMFMSKMKSLMFYPVNKILFWSFVVILILLTWIGMCPVEDPYILTGQILTVLYFLYYIINPIMMKMWDLVP
uniref:Cytochrome b n=1 Tax=Parhyale hawaiensis TaxID=317513 RepID=Q6DVI2_9CRUS|nr:cytochrome b [Parhyale hawaiensis]AAT69317.1 cytochrome b [Parhyale hawaiensis]AYB71612.1 cytochrome b [Parhyale hawaiensis]